MTVREAMAENIVTFTFVKLSTRSQRIATGTRDLNLIPVANHPKNPGTKDKEGLLTFFDWEKQAWRSCVESTIYPNQNSWDIKKPEMLHKIKVYEELNK